MTGIEALSRGRAAFQREAWSEAYTHLSAADRDTPLEPGDLDFLATAAYLIGNETASADARARAHNEYLQRGETIPAARSAFWLAFSMLDKRDQQAQAGGWLARARRLLDECPEECAEHGLWLCAFAFQNIGKGDIAAARTAFDEAARIGARFRHPELTALARHGQGRMLIRMNKTADGLAMLDEVMLAVTCGEVAPMVAGVVYCSAISACHEVFDSRRAQEWTMALVGWCAAHPDMLPFRGRCLVRRSELLQLHGAWQEAIDEAERACERLTGGADHAEAGAAHYQQAELLRLRGEFEKADEAYRRASHAGRTPYPGLALLRLAQNQLDTATVAIRRALQETTALRARTQVLCAFVEIMLAAPDVPAARGAAEELTRMAGGLDAPLLRAASAHASGAVALAEGDVNAAVASLRDAWDLWRRLDAPYEIAQVRALVGRAYRQLGDEEGARMEFDAAQEAFERLGAAPDAARVGLLLKSSAPPSGGLTGREVEVLRLIAAGKSNRAIAGELGISEKTVARHISNMFVKLDLSSRSAATAYAYQHKLL